MCGRLKFRGISQEQGFPALHQASQLRVPVQEDKSPKLLAAKTHVNWVGKRNFWSPKQFSLEYPHIDLLRLKPAEL